MIGKKTSRTGISMVLYQNKGYRTD